MLQVQQDPPELLLLSQAQLAPLELPALKVPKASPVKQHHKERLGLQDQQVLQALLELKVLPVLPAHKDPPEPTLRFLDQRELRAQLDHKVIPERKEPPEQQDHKVIPGRKVRRGLPDRKGRLERLGLREQQAQRVQLDLVELLAQPAQPVRVYRLGGRRGKCWRRAPMRNTTLHG